MFISSFAKKSGTKEGSTLEKFKKEAAAMLEKMKEGMENLECVLRQCMQDGEWGLFEENNELQALWRRFCTEIYNGNGAQAASLANKMLQVISPQQIVERWNEFRQSINSDDGIRIVVAIKSFLEQALEYLRPPTEPQAQKG